MHAIRLRQAVGDSDAAFIADQMLASALEFAEPGVPFGLAEQVSQPETKRRWHQSCREKVLRSTQPGVASHTRLWIAEDERDGTIVGSVGIQPDPGSDKGSNEVVQAVLAHSSNIEGRQRALKLGELVYAFLYSHITSRFEFSKALSWKPLRRASNRFLVFGHRSFYVAKAGRGKGVGSLLMDTALAFAVEARYDALSLYVFRALSSAIRLYMRFGFFVVAQYVRISNTARACSCFRRCEVMRLTAVEPQVLCAWALGRRQRYGEGSFPKPVAETLMLPRANFCYHIVRLG